MAFWHIFGRFAMSDEGETIQRISESTSISSNGTVYNHSGSTTLGSDGSVYMQSGSSSSDGSFRSGSSADGLGAVFNRVDTGINRADTGFNRVDTGINRVSDSEKRIWGDDW
jgi:hypothetical protein